MSRKYNFISKCNVGYREERGVEGPKRLRRGVSMACQELWEGRIGLNGNSVGGDSDAGLFSPALRLLMVG